MVECMICDKNIELIDNNDTMPNDAMYFNSHGNYGSRQFDSMNRWLKIYICDDCVVERAHKVLVVSEKYQQPQYDIIPWNPSEYYE